MSRVRASKAILSVVGFAASAGVPPPVLLSAAQMDPELLSGPDTDVLHAHELRLWEEAARLTGDCDFGLHLAEWIAGCTEDLFDVLAHVAFALPPETREDRAAKAKVFISSHFNGKQQAFLDFVLQHYVRVGVEELDQEKLTPILRLKYRNSLTDAVADLGKPDEIGRAFYGFQRYLYDEVA